MDNLRFAPMDNLRFAPMDNLRFAPIGRFALTWSIGISHGKMERGTSTMICGSNGSNIVFCQNTKGFLGRSIGTGIMQGLRVSERDRGRG